MLTFSPPCALDEGSGCGMKLLLSGQHEDYGLYATGVGGNLEYRYFLLKDTLEKYLMGFPTSILEC